MRTGQIFSQNDKIIKQIDVVIFDNIFSNYLKKDSFAYLFPCESIYGSIEVKSMLNKIIKYDGLFVFQNLGNWIT